MERVDIIDEQTNILYQASKKEAHEKGLLHKCIVAEVINSQGQMMLIKPASHKQDTRQYVSPVGGHVKAGETDEKALEREVKEEIGISNFTYQLKGSGIFDRHVLGRHENHYFILYEIFTNEEPRLGDEAKSYKRFTKSELKTEIQKHPQDFGAPFYYLLKKFYSELL